jgi:hypothetical protein
VKMASGKPGRSQCPGLSPSDPCVPAVAQARYATPRYSRRRVRSTSGPVRIPTMPRTPLPIK